MKKSDLDKNLGMKIVGQMQQAVTHGRFGKRAAMAPDRREQRRIDQSLGLVPFAVKLNGDLVKRVQVLAQESQTGVNEVVAELLLKGLDG
jgi:hypothetical protein